MVPVLRWRNLTDDNPAAALRAVYPYRPWRSDLDQDRNFGHVIQSAFAILAQTPEAASAVPAWHAWATVGVILPYSRDHESEADLVGLRYMAGAGYDPQESIQFWKRFSKSSGGAPPEFLSTHPGTTTRISDLQNHLAEANRRYQTASQKYGSGEKI